MPIQLDETFTVEATTELLLRRVVPRRGKPYEHGCSKEVYDEVARAIDQMGQSAFTMESIRDAVGGRGDDEAKMPPPWSQVAVAVAFLKERGCIVPARGRKHVAASDFVYEDALIEYHALREKGPEQASNA